MQLYPGGPPPGGIGRCYIPDDEPGLVRLSGTWGFIDFTAAEARELAAMLLKGADESDAAVALSVENVP